MEDITVRPTDWPYLSMAVGLAVLIVSWLTTWIVIPLFFGISIEGGFWGASFSSGQESEWGSWFHENWSDEEGVVAAGVGSILGGLGAATILGSIMVHFVPKWQRDDWMLRMPWIAMGGALAVLVGNLLVRYGIVTALDGNVDGSDWESGFWFAWVACSILLAASLILLIQDRRPSRDLA